jgi:hypothetical protein
MGGQDGRRPCAHCADFFHLPPSMRLYATNCESHISPCPEPHRVHFDQIERRLDEREPTHSTTRHSHSDRDSPTIDGNSTSAHYAREQGLRTNRGQLLQTAVPHMHSSDRTPSNREPSRRRPNLAGWSSVTWRNCPCTTVWSREASATSSRRSTFGRPPV